MATICFNRIFNQLELAIETIGHYEFVGDNNFMLHVINFIKLIFKIIIELI